MLRSSVRSLFTALACLAAFALSSTSAQAATCRIEPFGDSITQGYGSFVGGYRYALVTWPPLVGGSPLSIQMVGAQVDTTFPGLVAANQHHHSGVPGWRNDQLATAAALQPPYFVHPGGQAPNIVLVHAGTNDIHQGASASTAAFRLQTLLVNLSTKYPSSKLIVAKIIPFGPQPEHVARNQVVVQYNAAIPGIVTNLNAFYPPTNPKFFIADMHAYFPTNHLWPDGIHPTDNGYYEMGVRWSMSIEAIADLAGC
ncbi:GDSL-type esterase/lipase family protein [Sorangium sp. So ce854]|uniref:GDSL-type esterase/lipase family protein n=1 Tax=Sorangium sp. So ce854 TaxID=3133322 RepID=UPI003F618E2C